MYPNSTSVNFYLKTYNYTFVENGERVDGKKVVVN
jgi:hypothetical protein